jgi:hypothetical protein
MLMFLKMFNEWNYERVVEYAARLRNIFSENGQWQIGWVKDSQFIAPNPTLESSLIRLFPVGRSRKDLLDRNEYAEEDWQLSIHFTAVPFIMLELQRIMGNSLRHRWNQLSSSSFATNIINENLADAMLLKSGLFRRLIIQSGTITGIYIYAKISQSRYLRQRCLLAPMLSEKSVLGEFQSKLDESLKTTKSLYGPWLTLTSSKTGLRRLLIECDHELLRLWGEQVFQSYLDRIPIKLKDWLS